MASALSDLKDDDTACQFWGAWSAVLLGDKRSALEAVMQTGLAPGVHRARAFQLALQVMNTRTAHSVLRRLGADQKALRWLIQGSGIVGDPADVPWLINQMAGETTARVSGEAFSLITGVDLAKSGLKSRQPENFEYGPNDDPEDPNVEMDPDEGLPWLDAERARRWWASNAARFQEGTRYFMGAPVTREHCIAVLKSGYQRQRVLAAQYLCLLEPGTPLFNTSAPAWRQQRLLAQME
jgi:uncharacterized protein (TIGR02270 family)